MKKKIGLFILLSSFILNSNAQDGSKENLKPFLAELKAPRFLKLLERSKQKIKKDSTEIIIFEGFSDYNTQKCSFTVYKFRKSYMFHGYKVQDSVSTTNYTYQNQKIIYKEVWFNRNKLMGHLDIIYYRNGTPQTLFSFSKNTTWLFDREGNIINKLGSSHIDNSIEFNYKNYKFTPDELGKIREDLRKITLKFDNSQDFDWENNSIKDWKTLNKTKEYLKHLFKTKVDLYYDIMSDNSIFITSENGELYAIEKDGRVVKQYNE